MARDVLPAFLSEAVERRQLPPPIGRAPVGAERVGCIGRRSPGRIGGRLPIGPPGPPCCGRGRWKIGWPGIGRPPCGRMPGACVLAGGAGGLTGAEYTGRGPVCGTISRRIGCPGIGRPGCPVPPCVGGRCTGAVGGGRSRRRHVLAGAIGRRSCGCLRLFHRSCWFGNFGGWRRGRHYDSRRCAAACNESRSRGRLLRGDRFGSARITSAAAGFATDCG